MQTTLKNFISRYHPRSIRSLVYMAQQSEYHPREFLKWLWRTGDFLRVEQRKTLVKTPKALLFLAALYLFAILWFAFTLWVLLVGVVWWKYLVFLLMFLGAPFVVAYGVVGVIFVCNLLQWPIETVIVRHARQKLAKHAGFKIAVAGSFGKTSMRGILKTVLSAGKKVAAPPGSYNTPLGIAKFVRGLKGDEEALIFEMGEYYKGDIKRLCNLTQPDIGVITGVNEAHLEKFKDIERTRATIFELADYLASSVVSASLSVIPATEQQRSSRRLSGIQGLLYINGENELARKSATGIPLNKEGADCVPPKPLAKGASAMRGLLSPLPKGATHSDVRGVVFYSRSGAGNWKVERAQTSLAGTSFTLQSGTESISVRSHLLGLHQVGSLTAAAHIASKLGLTAEQIEKGIDATKPFEHRLEPKTDAQGVTTLDDSYNGNPDGVRVVIEFLSSLSREVSESPRTEGVSPLARGVSPSSATRGVSQRRGRCWYVTPGLVEMGPKKEEIHKEIGRHLARAGIEKMVLVRNSVTPFIFAGLQEEKYGGEVLWFEKALDAFAALPNLTVKGDIVLLQNDWPDQYV